MLAMRLHFLGRVALDTREGLGIGFWCQLRQISRPHAFTLQSYRSFVSPNTAIEGLLSAQWQLLPYRH
jgi:hypothetical protein